VPSGSTGVVRGSGGGAEESGGVKDDGRSSKGYRERAGRGRRGKQCMANSRTGFVIGGARSSVTVGWQRGLGAVISESNA